MLTLIRYGNSRRLGTITEKGTSKKFSLEDIFKLIQSNKKFEVFHKDRNITNEVCERAIKKYWTKKEEKILKENFGSITITTLRKELLPKKSIGQIRHKADLLSLTIDRKWQEHEITALTALRKSGCSYLQVSRILQRPKRACEIKAHKLGITHAGGHFDEYDGIEKVMEKYKNIPSITKGKIAEDLSSIKLLENGIDIFLPYTPNHTTDLLAINGNKVAKLQVKSAILNKKTDRFRIPLQRKNSRTNERFFYDSKDIDFFILYCLGINVIYIVPYSVCKEHPEAKLYPHRSKLIMDGKFDWEQYRDSYSLIKDFIK